jgi:hypothetical protein
MLTAAGDAVCIAKGVASALWGLHSQGEGECDASKCKYYLETYLSAKLMTSKLLAANDRSLFFSAFTAKKTLAPSLKKKVSHEGGEGVSTGDLFVEGTFPDILKTVAHARCLFHLTKMFHYAK